MIQESKHATIKKLRRAAQYTKSRMYSPDGYPCGNPACCEALTHVEATTDTRNAFANTFRPRSAGSWWWPNPWGEDVDYASNGKTYKPSDARCIALLLMAEMVRTGDV